jgi:hypothetical protein
VPAPLFGWMHEKPWKEARCVIAWMLDDVELRELRIFLAVLVAAQRKRCRSRREPSSTIPPG